MQLNRVVPSEPVHRAFLLLGCYRPLGPSGRTINHSILNRFWFPCPDLRLEILRRSLPRLSVSNGVVKEVYSLLGFLSFPMYNSALPALCNLLLWMVSNMYGSRMSFLNFLFFFLFSVSSSFTGPTIFFPWPSYTLFCHYLLINQFSSSLPINRPHHANNDAEDSWKCHCALLYRYDKKKIKLMSKRKKMCILNRGTWDN